MEIRINIHRDSHNTHPTEKLTVRKGAALVCVELCLGDRRIEVGIEDLKRALFVLDGVGR